MGLWWGTVAPVAVGLGSLLAFAAWLWREWRRPEEPDVRAGDDYLSGTVWDPRGPRE